MSGLSDLFVDTSGELVCNVSGHVTTEYVVPHNGDGAFQLAFFLFVYGFILTQASNLIADGSELLTLVLNPGLVGGLVLPLMGAVPDGAIVLFSGFGADAAESLKVGVGTLAGSTIMLLTVPWGMCQIMGRVDTDATGKALYAQRPKLTNGWSLTKTGVTCTAEIPRNAKIMLATSFTYLIIQGPSFALQARGKHHHQTPEYVADHERWWAFTGLITATLTLIAYSVYQVSNANALEQQKDRIDAARKDAFKHKLISLSGMKHILREAAAARRGTSGSSGERSPLVPQDRLRELLKPVFKKFDVDNSGQIDRTELKALLNHLQVKLSSARLNELLREIGGEDDLITFDELVVAVTKWGDSPIMTSSPSFVSSLVSMPQGTMRRPSMRRKSTLGPGGFDDAGAETGDAGGAAARGISSGFEVPTIGEGARGEEEDGPELMDDDSASESEDESDDEDDGAMTPFQIKAKSAVLLIVGVVVVSLFSDPMVSVMAETGKRLNVSPFYVAFVVSPLASNASEFISSMVFASRRTRSSITLTFSALLGAATMNNTFCLAIFLALVFAKRLAWTFSAEVTSILVVEAIMCWLAMRKNHETWRAWVVLALFPMSIVLVYFLENVVGWD